MTYYAFPVSREEVVKIESADLSEVSITYDKAVDHVVINDEVYTFHKDYLDLTNHRRIFLVIKKDYGNDK